MEFKFDSESVDPYLDYEEGTIRIVKGNGLTVVIFVETRTGKAHVVNIFSNND